MNKKTNRLYIFILMLVIVSCSSQNLFARRGILSNMPEQDSHPNFSSFEKEQRPEFSNFNPNTERFSSPQERFQHKNHEAERHRYKEPIEVETKQVGSVAIPQIPTPPQLDKAKLEDRIKTPNETGQRFHQENTLQKKDESHRAHHNEHKHHNEKNKQHHEEKVKERHKHKETSAEEKHLQKIATREEKEHQMVRFYFEDATLENLVRYMEELYDVKFFTDDDLNPTPQGGAVLKGHRITFTTNKPLTRTEAWDLFLKFLDMAGLTVIPGEGDTLKSEHINPNKPHKKPLFYRITTLTNANKEVLPTFFNTKLDAIPDNSTKVRYVFFVKNSPLATIQEIVKSFSSSSAGPPLIFPDLNALIITDKGSNIRALMHIIKEFDKEMPEAMSVLKLKRSDAIEVARLYESLTRAEAPQGAARFVTQRSQPKSLYFPVNARVIPEPRTNSLILLGPKAALIKIEEFIIKHVDVELDMPYSPLHIYELQYTQARNIAQILNQTAASFGSGTAAAQYGGVRDGNQYFGPLSITPDESGNRLIIKAEENDYIKLVDIIKKLDVVQPQTIIEVLIVDVTTGEDKILGTQIRNKSEGSLIKNVDFQRTGLPVSGGNFGGVVNASNGSLLGNLISLASNAATGSTVLSVGNNNSGIWGIMSILQQNTKTDVISNPFLLATNNYQAQVTLGSTRNIATSVVQGNGQNSIGYSQDQANLEVTITPQISSDGSIQMAINITIQDYSSSNVESGDKTIKTVQTAATVQNREVLVLGGIIKNKVTQLVRKVPLLGDIPGLGWLFKTKSKVKSQSNLLVFICPQIIYPGMEVATTEYMKKKAEVTTALSRNSGAHDQSGKDPINNLFFGSSGHDETVKQMSEFMNQNAPKKERKNKKKEKKKIVKAPRKSSKKRKRFRG